MILIWRGWGLLAVVALFPLLGSCAGLIDVEPFWVFMLAAVLSLLLAGAVCVYCGTRWNWHGVEHSLYFVPLQVWGWVYLALVGVFALAAVAGAFRQGLDKPGRLSQAIAGVVGLVVVAGVAVFLPRLARPKAAASDPTQQGRLDRRSGSRAYWDRQGAAPGAAPDRGA